MVKSLVMFFLRLCVYDGVVEDEMAARRQVPIAVCTVVLCVSKTGLIRPLHVLPFVSAVHLLEFSVFMQWDVFAKITVSAKARRETSRRQNHVFDVSVGSSWLNEAE